MRLMLLFVVFGAINAASPINASPAERLNDMAELESSGGNINSFYAKESTFSTIAKTQGRWKYRLLPHRLIMDLFDVAPRSSATQSVNYNVAENIELSPDLHLLRGTRTTKDAHNSFALLWEKRDGQWFILREITGDK